MTARTHYKTHEQPCTMPVSKYSPKMSACGSKTCNFDTASSFTGWVFASVAKETGVRVSVVGGAGVVQFDLPTGTTLNQSCVRQPSGTQAAIGCPVEDLT